MHVLFSRDRRALLGSGSQRAGRFGWWPVRDRSGGPVIEQAAHVLDLARFLAGEVAEVFAMGDGRPPAVSGADVDGVTTATLRFRSGAVATSGGIVRVATVGDPCEHAVARARRARVAVAIQVEVAVEVAVEVEVEVAVVVAVPTRGRTAPPTPAARPPA